MASWLITMLLQSGASLSSLAHPLPATSNFTQPRTDDNHRKMPSSQPTANNTFIWATTNSLDTAAVSDSEEQVKQRATRNEIPRSSLGNKSIKKLLQFIRTIRRWICCSRHSRHSSIHFTPHSLVRDSKSRIFTEKRLQHVIQNKVSCNCPAACCSCLIQFSLGLHVKLSVRE